MAATEWDLAIEPASETEQPDEQATRAIAPTRGWPLKYKIGLIITLVIALAAVIVAGIGWDLRSQLYQARRDSLRSTVAQATAVVAHYQQRIADGFLDVSEAKSRAEDALSVMRFGPQNRNFIFVTSSDDRVLLHPIRNAGDSLDGYVSADGVHAYRELNRRARTAGHGFVDFQSADKDDGPTGHEIAYAQRFKPWGWNIAASDNIDNLHAAFIRQLIKYGLILGGFATLVALALALLARNIYRTLGGETFEARAQLERMATGDLGQTTEIAKRHADSLMASVEAMRRDLAAMITRIRHGSESIDSAAGEIADGNADLSTRTQQQAASLEETAASMEELTSTVSNNAQHADNASTLAHRSSEALDDSRRLIGDVVNTMGEIRRGADEISEITTLIDDIAFQTNLLALNASVEAARAGEHGRGFAVVASEVRKLAHRSADAAKNISGVVERSVACAHSGAARVDEASASMKTLGEHVEHTRTLMAEISTASSEQSRGIEQVNQAVTQMDEVTQHNAALVEQAAAASQSLRDQAGALRRTVARFTIADDEPAEA